MKVQVMVLMAFAVLLTACSSVPPPIRSDQALSVNWDPYQVDVEVIDGNRLKLSPPQGDDARGKQPGWVGFARGTYGTITFATTEYPAKISCTDDPQTTAEWVITEVVLSQFGDRQTQKGERFGEGPLGWMKHAFPTLTEEGYLVKQSIDEAQTFAVLMNANNGNQVAFYDIELRRCDGTGEPLRADPGIGNRGR